MNNNYCYYYDYCTVLTSQHNVAVTIDESELEEDDMEWWWLSF